MPASAFDRQYLQRAGVHADREAIGLYHAQVLRADPDPALKQFAESMLPVVDSHLQAAKALIKQEKHPDAAPRQHRAD